MHFYETVLTIKIMSFLRAISINTSINIVTQLWAFLLLAIGLQRASLVGLAILACVFGLALIWAKNRLFLRSLVKFKWFFLVLIVIFAFNTPGEHILPTILPFSPSLEGLAAGAKQVLRISVIMAAIAIILTVNTRQQLISGIYCFCKPLQLVGVKIDTFVARLWLTLHYTEQAQANKDTSIINSLSQLNKKSRSPNLTAKATENFTIQIEQPRYTWADYAITSLILLILLLMIRKAIF
jgi:energy-coupling factor transporter transmembrane protein EcfT